MMASLWAGQSECYNCEKGSCQVSSSRPDKRLSDRSTSTTFEFQISQELRALVCPSCWSVEAEALGIILICHVMNLNICSYSISYSYSTLKVPDRPFSHFTSMRTNNGTTKRLGWTFSYFSFTYRICSNKRPLSNKRPTSTKRLPWNKRLSSIKRPLLAAISSKNLMAGKL